MPVIELWQPSSFAKKNSNAKLFNFLSSDRKVNIAGCEPGEKGINRCRQITLPKGCPLRKSKHIRILIVRRSS